MRRTSLALLLAGWIAPGVGRADPAAVFEQPWQWKDEHAATVSLDRWRGGPVVLTLFYRTCEARCAPTIERLRKLEETLVRRGRHPHFVLVTLDPRNDTPARLRAFKRSRRLPEESWHLLGGPGLQTRALQQLLDFHAAGDDGHLEHETKIFVYEGGVLKKTLRGWRFSDEDAIEGS